MENLYIESSKLNRKIKIYIQLPKQYNEGTQEYPTLYMHDGEIMFNDFENDESDIGILDTYNKAKVKTEAILIGIEGGKGRLRINDLCPFPINLEDKITVVGGSTDVYLDFIVNELKPLIEQLYRTKQSPKHSGMLGISLGGMCTLYASAKLTDYFSNYAFVSSAHYRVQKEMLEFIKNEEFKNVLYMYSDVGTNESDDADSCEQFLTSNKDIYEILKTKSNISKFQYRIVDGSKHETSYWSERFGGIIDTMFGNE